MFNDSKYTTWYYQIIENSRKRHHVGYTEKHHIIPRCLGGDNSAENIVILTAREHFVCHRLLIKMVNKNHKHKMVYAAWQQSRSAKFNGARITSRTFSILKEELSKSYTGRKRPPFSEQWRENMSKRASGDKNNMFGKHHSEKAKEKISKNRRGQCIGESNPFFQGTHKPEVIANIVTNNSRYHTCPHCGKIGKSNSMKRWHFDNCSVTQ